MYHLQIAIKINCRFIEICPVVASIVHSSSSFRILIRYYIKCLLRYRIFLLEDATFMNFYSFLRYFIENA
jgi:hypothetical protein